MIKYDNFTPTINRNIKRGTFKEAHISDIHFGVLDPKYQYDILEEQFLKKIENLKLDIISINGDLFDHKFMSNSDVVMYTIRFIGRLVDICRTNNTTLILIHGTNYHDASQLKLFYHYLEDNTVDVRIIENACIISVKGKRIVCIPEEYGKGEEYYFSVLKTTMYDSAYMHGTYVNSIYGKTSEDLNASREPVFSMNSFSLCNGPIISGHVHVASCFDKYFYYTGSPYRWSFGEEQAKGFIILLHNLDSGEHYVHFEEITSFRYDTVNLDNLLMGDPVEVISYISNLKSQGIDNIRIEFTKECPENIEILKNFYKTDSSIKLNIFSKEDQDRKIIEEELKEKYKDYDYIIDNKLSEYEILSRYINQQKGYTYITTEELIEFLKNG